MSKSNFVQSEQLTQADLLSVVDEDLDRMKQFDLPVNSFGTDSQQSSLQAEGGSYFSDFQNQPFVRPMRTPNQLNARADLIFEPHGNRLFEMLRQVAIQQNMKSFPQLAARTQALARLGGLLVMYREDFIDRYYHFQVGHEVIAMLDRAKGKFLLKSRIPVLDFSSISTHDVPRSSRLSSEGFEQLSVQDAVWTYARHDPEAMLDLPARLGTGMLHLRKLPKVSDKMISDSDLSLISQFLKHPKSFDQVREKTQLNIQLLQIRALTCLYLTRCISVA